LSSSDTSAIAVFRVAESSLETFFIISKTNVFGRGSGLPDGLFSIQKIPICVNFGVP
jgi:hypothetical protein